MARPRPSPIGRRHRDPCEVAVVAHQQVLLLGEMGEMGALAVEAVMMPQEELDRYEPEPLGKQPAALPSGLPGRP